jgi:hypothetical protein
MLAMCAVAIPARAQSGMEFEELRLKLQTYFADELIADLQKSMPKGAPYRVWGWDVGDFTGDGFNDVAFSIYISGSRKKECQVFLFGDIDGFLVNVAHFNVGFVELPLEVGVVIKDTVCYVARKRKADDWGMKGYRFLQGSMVLVDEFNTNKVASYPHEDYHNYFSLRTRERFEDRDGEELFSTDYLTIPCYERGRLVYAGIQPEVQAYSIDQVLFGSYWWKGADDASFSARFVYDAENLYVRVAVTDSNVVTGWCDTCPADRVELWFEVNAPTDEHRSRTILSVNRKGVTPRNESDTGVYALAVRIGDFADIRPSVKVRTTDELDPLQNRSLQQVRVVTAPRTNGYVVKLRIPLELLGFSQPPLDEDGETEFGCTVVVYDVDNEFRPEETTAIATSPLRELDPASYGAIRFLPSDRWYGESRNIFTDGVLATLRELGF